MRSQMECGEGESRRLVLDRPTLKLSINSKTEMGRLLTLAIFSALRGNNTSESCQIQYDNRSLHNNAGMI